MKTIWPEIIIFSVDRKERSETNNNKFRTLAIQYLDNPKQATGFFEGSTEQAFIVTGDKEAMIQKLCADSGQDSYLFVHGDRTAELRDASGKTVANLPGTFREVDEEVAHTLSAYTFFNGRYYGVL